MLIVTPSPGSIVQANGEQVEETQNAAPTEAQKKLINTFDNHIKDYLRQRNQVKEKLPKLSKDSTAEQIHSYQVAFVEALRAMRAGTNPGYIFQPEIAAYIRALIKDEFKGSERVELRQSVLEADTKGVPLRVNYPYPESKELNQTPPTLLLRLPQLPKEVKYRFVGTNMLLVDTDNGLIVDYMTKALP